MVQTQKEGESSQQFAERVQTLIAKRAGLKAVPWDGYLKYYNLAAKVCLIITHCVSCVQLSASLPAWAWAHTLPHSVQV